MKDKQTTNTDEAIELAERGREWIRQGIRELRSAIAYAGRPKEISLEHYDAYLFEQIEEHVEKSNPYNTDIADLIRELKGESE